MNADQAYRELVQSILDTGEVHENRTGVNTRRIWGHMTKLDLSEGFPLLTQKKMAVKSAFTEILGFVRGETDVRWYQERGCNIWNADHARWHGKDLERDKKRLDELGHDMAGLACTERGKIRQSIDYRTYNPNSLGAVYGAQWRDFGGYDQLGEIITALKAGSHSRRLIMSAWRPDEMHRMALPPCHIAYHFVKRGEFVDVAMWQRSH